MEKKKQEEMTKMALLMRFRTTIPNEKTAKFISYKAIASILNLTINEVQHICRKSLLPKKKITQQKLIRVLEKEHVDFLTNPRQLELWAGLTMKERTVFFHRTFTHKRIAVTSLRRLY